MAVAMETETDVTDVETTGEDEPAVEEAKTEELVKGAEVLDGIVSIDEELAITEADKAVNEEFVTVEPEELAWKNVPDNCSATPFATSFWMACPG